MLTSVLSVLTPLLMAIATVAVPSKPNIVLIITDDQDKESFQRRFLPRIHEHLVDAGVYYENFFSPVSLCCPARVSLLRTQHAHNHNITFVSRPWGGWEVFNEYGYVKNTLPDHLQAAGYDTYYVGKYMNGHTDKNCERLPVSGFTSSDFLVDPYTYDYWNPGFSRDNGPVKIHPGSYSTDLVRDKSLAYLDDSLSSDKPFFLGIAPIAPHSWLEVDGRGKNKETPLKITMEIPAPHYRHANMFIDEQLPRKPSWNPDEPMGVSWVRTLPKLNATQEAYLDEFHRGRVRSLQAVDEMVELVVKKLDEAGQLDNTYIFYTSDNGFALGSHRRQPGKTLGFEEDMHVPLIARGPGMPRGKVDSLSSYGMVDLSRTILDIAGADTGYQNDGVKINLHQETQLLHQNARHSISEYWVLALDEGFYSSPMRVNNTYRTLRIHDEVDSQEVTFSYSVWCTGERELYNLVDDPYQINNLLAPLNALGRFAPFDSLSTMGSSLLSIDLQRTCHRLDALLLVLKTCKGSVCTNPYSAFFPGLTHMGEIYRFSQITDSSFDRYFEELPKVQFSECALGYQSRLEKPEWEDQWAFRHGGIESGVGPQLPLQV